MPKLFVYGTLKREQCREFYLRKEQFLGIVRSTPEYRLLDLGSYPALVRNGKTSIVGELYAISDQCLEQLDVVEGVSENLYERGRIRLTENAWANEAVTYFYLQAHDDAVDAGTSWP